MGASDANYGCVVQREDPKGKVDTPFSFPCVPPTPGIEPAQGITRRSATSRLLQTVLLRHCISGCGQTKQST